MYHKNLPGYDTVVFLSVERDVTVVVLIRDLCFPGIIVEVVANRLVEEEAVEFFTPEIVAFAGIVLVTVLELVPASMIIAGFCSNR